MDPIASYVLLVSQESISAEREEMSEDKLTQVLIFTEPVLLMQKNKKLNNKH